MITKEEYLKIRPIIHKGDAALKANNFDEFFKIIMPGVSSDVIADIYEFFAVTLEMDPINYMTVIPKKFFSRIPVETITIPSNIRMIDAGAFTNNKTITKVEFAAGSPIEDLPEDCFNGCRNLETVQLGNKTTYFDRDCFEGCEKVTVYLPAANKSVIRFADDDTKMQLKGHMKLV